MAKVTRAAREVRHPGVIPVIEVGHTEGWLYVVAERADGPRLAEALADGPFGAGRAAATARDLADALACAHEHGQVHGAIHPSGVVLDPRRGPRWLDFGVADDGPANPAYLPPERLDDSPADATQTGDQYALGVLLYEMLCGEPPASGAADEEVIEAVRAGEFLAGERTARVCRATLNRSASRRWRATRTTDTQRVASWATTCAVGSTTRRLRPGGVARSSGGGAGSARRR